MLWVFLLISFRNIMIKELKLLEKINHKGPRCTISDMVHRRPLSSFISHQRLPYFVLLLSSCFIFFAFPCYAYTFFSSHVCFPFLYPHTLLTSHHHHHRVPSPPPHRHYLTIFLSVRLSFIYVILSLCPQFAFCSLRWLGSYFASF